MKRFLAYFIIALLAFSIGYSLFWGTEVHNLKVEIREYERRAESDNSDGGHLWILRQARHRLYLMNLCVGQLREFRKEVTDTNIARCLREREDIPLE